MIRLIVGSLFLSGALGASWNYTHTNLWAQNFPLCGGSAQSPIDIDTSVVETADYSDFAFSIGYKMDMKGKLYNNGHAIQYEVDPGYKAYISGGPVGNRTYVLAQYHFHWGFHPEYASSEHTFNGKHYAAEMHFVHYNSKFSGLGDALASNESDALAVVGVFMDMNNFTGQGPRNRADINLHNLEDREDVEDRDDHRRRPDRHPGQNWGSRPNPKPMGEAGSGCCNGGSGSSGSLAGESSSIQNLIRAAEQTSRLPIGEKVSLEQTLSHYFSDIDHLSGLYHYMGSLTTPTCNEAVVWIVLDRPLSVPKALLESFRLNLDDHGRPIEDNHREVMPLNGRKIKLYRAGPA